MIVRLFLFAILLVSSIFAAEPRKVSNAEVARVQKDLLLIDTHNDVTSFTVDGYDIGSHGSKMMTDISRLRAGGVGAQFFAVYVDKKFVEGNHSAHRTLDMIDTVRHDIIDRYPKDFSLALTANDIVRIHRQGKIAALLGIEGGHAIEDDLRLLRDYYLLGVRYMTLTHTNTNSWADSSGDINNPNVHHHNGLTDFGKQVVHEMNRLGMMVDISHTADKTFWDALATSSAPIIASHSSCRALADVPRNMTDEMIAALAKKGGVIQINFYCNFLVAPPPPKNGKEQFSHATLADVVAHIDHAVKVAGIDHVGLGSDFDGIECAPDGLKDVSQFPNLTRALLEKGYTEEDLRKLYGANLLRVMHAVEAESRRLQGRT